MDGMASIIGIGEKERECMFFFLLILVCWRESEVGEELEGSTV